MLDENSFVISTAKQYPTFLRGYADIYKYHLPVYVSADAILESVHQSYDEMLLAFERDFIIDELKELLSSLTANAQTKPLASDTRADLMIYLGVTTSLLNGKAETTGDTDLTNQIKNLFDKAKTAAGLADVTLFGVERTVDFSQFTPRGHYNGSADLQNYFRAMMWLGRIDFRLIETLRSGQTVFHRPQYEAMSALRSLFSEQDLVRWQNIEQILGTFVGESDYMTLSEVSALHADLSRKYPQEAPLSDGVIAQGIIDGNYGAQQIASHFIVIDKVVEGGYPLNRSFALFGQRYVVDSEVFSKVVFDRLHSDGAEERRMLPNSLDVAYAALNNPKAVDLMKGEFNRYPALPAALNNTQAAINGHDSTFWQANMYNLWLKALRTLSPSGDMTQQVAEGLPEVAATEAWSRRILNTQLGSWAQLRHDTLLYAKQSYSGVPGCEFPDAYVEPYPEFFAAIGQYAELGKSLVELVDNEGAAERMARYWQALADTAKILGEMAANQRRGEPHTQEQLAFINNAVRIEEEDGICVILDVPNGWYADLFFGDREKSITFDPTVADVHTAPGDQNGNTVGWVKHVATGKPRLTTVAVKNCNGVGIYSGMTFGYHEFTTSNFKRLTDEEWAAELEAGPAPLEVPWIEQVQAR